MDVLMCIEVFLGIVCTLVAAFFTYWFYLSRNHYWVDQPIPYESPFPFFGLIIAVFQGKAFLAVDGELCKKHGKLFGAYNGMIPAIYVTDPELLKTIFVKDFTSFSTRRTFISGNPLIDNMVSVLEGNDQWRNIRNTMTPAFSTGKLKKMLPLLCECAMLSRDHFENYAKKESEVDCKRLYGNYTLDVIANVAFGTRLDSHNDPDNEFIVHARKVFSAEFSWKTALSLITPKLARYLGLSFFPLDSIQFFKETTMAIVERRQKSKELRHDFLQIMMDSMKEGEIKEEPEETKDEESNINKDEPTVQSVENIKRKPLTLDEFLAQTILFFIAGYETTATTLSLVTYYLALNPAIQKKAQEEADRIWKDRKEIDVDALYEAKYLGAAIDETLRLSPPFSRLERTVMKDYVLGDTGVTLKKGMIVEIPAYVIHHDAELFPEPESFRPERFLEEDSTIQPYTYMPFGNGPRNCVAMRLALMEVKLCMLYILREFTFSPTPKTMIPIEYLNSPLLQPKNITLKVARR